MAGAHVPGRAWVDPHAMCADVCGVRCAPPPLPVCSLRGAGCCWLQRLEALREAHRDRIAQHNVHYLTMLRFLRGTPTTQATRVQ